MNLKVKKLKDAAVLPKRGSDQAAGYDLCACLDGEHVIIEAGQTVKIGTGLAIALEDGTAGLILPRSGLATKKGLRPANTPGLIDSDYRGEWIVAIHNDDRAPHKIENGERIAQLVIIDYHSTDFTEVDELDDTNRGEGGFGSTDNK